MSGAWGIAPNNPGGTVLVVACDDAYAPWIGPLALSLAQVAVTTKSHPLALHTHVINASGATRQELAWLRSALRPFLDLTFVLERGPADVGADAWPVLMACARFDIGHQLLESKSAGAVLILDVDTIAMNDFRPLLPPDPGPAIGVFPRSGQPPEMAFAAGAVYARGAEGRGFLATLGSEIRTRPLAWYVDQLALGATVERTNQAAGNAALWAFDRRLLDWDFAHDSAFWTGKGPRKVEDNAFTRAVQGLRDDLAPRRLAKVWIWGQAPEGEETA